MNRSSGSKVSTRLRRAKKARGRIACRKEKKRLTVHRSAKNIYAQVISECGTKTLVSASSLDKELRDSLKNGGNINAAEQVGKLVADRAIKAGVSEVAFDRSGFKYHGRVKALADSARESGLKF